MSSRGMELRQDCERIHVAKSNVTWQHDVNSRKHLPNIASKE